MSLKEWLKSLKRYEKSDSFKELLKYSEEKQEEIRLKNREIFKNRDKIELKYSYLNEKYTQIEVLEDLLPKIEDTFFSDYIKMRIERTYQAIDNSLQAEEIIYSEIDLNKIKRWEYYAIKAYLWFAIDIFSDKKKHSDAFKSLDPYVK